MGKSYRSLLAGLDPSQYLLCKTDERLCLLTGQSDFETSRLHEDKLAFLHAVTPPGAEITGLGFPWHEALSKPQRKKANLFTASVRNAWQYHLIKHDPVFQSAIAKTFAHLLKQTRKRLLLVTGSCGVAMLATALDRLPAPELEIWVAVVGPFGPRPKAEHLTRELIVQGTNDPWSKFGWKSKVDVRPNCGHLDYWVNDTVKHRCRSFFSGR